ncbi:MAG: glycoside hydrolase family 3 C-terminal domain-containing protein [Lachnospiraceae bacterium]|nr:glycoside hydrolase family 3 C-terminal domain-containing protein [Lachnospiraceae bacterium]
MKNDRNYRMQFDKQARDLVSKMTLEEKVYMMSGHCGVTKSFVGGNYNTVPYPFGGCARLGLEDLAFCDGPRGVVSGNSTCFPVAMARGATFDRELEYQVGQAIGKEVLANGGNFFGGVCTNVAYHPGAGRSQESFGEDPYHLGEMGVALTQGVQDQGVVACSKHFAFNSMERSRFKVDMSMDKRTEREVYLPHFKKIVDSGVGSVMNAYNLYNGEKCGHNDYLLREILKDGWGFDGFVMSDFMFGVTNAEKGIHGGYDVEMHFTHYYTLKKVKKGLDEGKITQAQIDDACIRIARVTLAFQSQRQKKPPVSVLACPEHIALARKVAEESITLLQNREHILPLKKTCRLALVGDLCNVENIGDHGSSKVRPPYVKTLVDGMKDCGADYTFIPTKDVKKSTAAIARADAVIMVAGMRHGDEGEYGFVMGGDRKTLELHKDERDMIDQVSGLNPNSVVILMGGNVVMTHSWKDKVKAILFAYYPGMEGGTALANILFGAVNPSGHLPFAIAARETDYPSIQWNTKHQHYDYYHGYRLLDKKKAEVDFPYGFGLSYTDFIFTDFVLAENQEDYAEFTATVQNTGRCAGATVPQLYVSFPESPVDRPDRILMGFQKVFLNPGEKKTVCFRVQKEELGWYDEKQDKFIQDPKYQAWLGYDEHNLLKTSLVF